MNVAILGAGLMGEWHARAARRAGATVSLVVDPDRSRGEKLASRFRGAEWSPNVESVAKADVRAVHVCTPLAHHGANVEIALAAGVSCLVEKPLTAGAADTIRLLGVARERGLVLCPSHQYLYQRGVLNAVNALDRIGPVRHCIATCCTAGADGGIDPGALAVDILPHPLSLLRRMLGERFSSFAWRAESSLPGELAVHAADAATAVSIVVSTRGRPTRNELEIIGERGSLHVDLFHGFAVESGSHVSRASKAARPLLLSSATFGASAANLVRRAVSSEPAFPGLNELVKRFHEAVRGESPSPIDSAETVDVALARDSIAHAIAGAGPPSAGRSGAAGDDRGGRAVR